MRKEVAKVLFVGLDVQAETIVVSVADAGGKVLSIWVIANRLEWVRKLIHKLGPVGHLRACYEAGPTGYVLYWQLHSYQSDQSSRLLLGTSRVRCLIA